MKSKGDLRKIYLEKRKRLAKENFTLKCENIYNQIIASPFYEKARKIFTYVSTEDEADTLKLIDKALQDKKIVAVPKTYKEHISFFQIKGRHVLAKGGFGILEPPTVDAAIPDEKTLIIVPGVVFDRHKNRIGYGKGYYDKYLQGIQTLQNVGICFDFQIIEAIPADAFDVKMDCIISNVV